MIYLISFSVDRICDVPNLISLLKRFEKVNPEINNIVTSHGGTIPGEKLPGIIELLEEKLSKLEKKKSAAELLMKLIEESPMAGASRMLIDSLRNYSNEYYFSEGEFNNLAEKYISHRKFEEVISILNFALQEFPNSALIYANLGKAYFGKGDWANSITYYKKSLDQFPENKDAIEMLKVLYKL